MTAVEWDGVERRAPMPYERKEPVKDPFLHFAAVFIMISMAILVVAFLGFWFQLDRIYNGNPSSGGREVVCAIGVDNAQRDPAVRVVWLERCAEFEELVAAMEAGTE